MFFKEIFKRFLDFALSMSADDAEACVGATNRALACVSVMSAAVRDDFRAPAPDGVDLHQRAVERTLLEGYVQDIALTLGICERILSAPVPLSQDPASKSMPRRS